MFVLNGIAAGIHSYFVTGLKFFSSIAINFKCVRQRVIATALIALHVAHINYCRSALCFNFSSITLDHRTVDFVKCDNLLVINVLHIQQASLKMRDRIIEDQ